MTRVALLNGPNLNLLGIREPEKYGTTPLAEIESRLVALGATLGVEVICSQHNGEGEMVDAIQRLRAEVAGAVINPGALGHYSLAVRDALDAIRLPYVEVHLTNLFAREPERRHSVMASGARGFICGFGANGYELALQGLVGAIGRGV